MTTRRLTVPQAAEMLGVSQQAIRQRIYRGTLAHEKGQNGRVYVLLTEGDALSRSDMHADISAVSSAELVEELRDRVRSLERQLDQEREANRENRRLLAAAFEKVPQLEPPQEASSQTRESPVTASEEPAKGKGPERRPSTGSRMSRDVCEAAVISAAVVLAVLVLTWLSEVSILP